MEQPPRRANNSERILAIRRRRARRRLRLTIVLVLLIAVLIAWFTGLFGAPLSLLGDAMDSIKIALTPGAGWPVPWSLSGYVTSLPLSGGAAVLGERELILYSANGNELRRIPHGFERPAITAGSTRVCLYNRSGTKLQVESRTRNLFTTDTDDPILLAQMSPNGTLAVATKTSVIVYSPLFENIWEWEGATETVTGLAFSSDNHRFTVATLHSAAGALGTTLRFFDANTDAEGTQVVIADGVPVHMQYLTRTQLLVVYDTCCAVYDTTDGAEIAHYNYGAQLLQGAAVTGDGTTALLFGSENYTDIAQVAVLDTNLKQEAAWPVQARALQVAAGHNMVYLLTADSVVTYGLDGTLRGETLLDAKPQGALCTTNSTLLFTSEAIFRLSAPSGGETEMLTLPVSSAAAGSTAQSTAAAAQSAPASAGSAASGAQSTAASSAAAPAASSAAQPAA